jgi:iron complex transport system permease protein
MNSYARFTLLVIGLGVALIFSACVGPDGLQPLWGDSSESAQLILWRIRIPRIVLACFLGAALGAAGAGYQGLFRNPLADPFVIGASSGAALGATVAIVMQWNFSFLAVDATTFCALLGSLATVWVVFLIARVGTQVPTVSLLLAGVAISSFLGAVVSLIMFVNEKQLSLIFGWLMGSLSSRDWQDVNAAWPLVLVGIGGLFLMSRSLDTLVFGDETASSLGQDIRKVRGGVVFFASLATAAAVAGGGIIGFVGLIAPHIGRLCAGTARHGLSLPAGAIAGATLLVLSDDVARTIVSPAEIPVGVVTALLGAPFFLFLLRRRLTS